MHNESLSFVYFIIKVSDSDMNSLTRAGCAGLRGAARAKVKNVCVRHLDGLLVFGDSFAIKLPIYDYGVCAKALKRLESV